MLADSNGSRLSLVSGTSGAAGQSHRHLLDHRPQHVTSTSPRLQLRSPPAPDASLTVDGVPLTGASNTVSSLIPGVTFQLLAPSAASPAQPKVQVVIANDNSGVESTVNQFVTDYNSLVSAINTQEGNDSSGNPEPLFGSPTLSLLQQQLYDSLNRRAPTAIWTRSSTAGARSPGPSYLARWWHPLDYSGSDDAGPGSDQQRRDTLSGSMSIPSAAARQTFDVGDSSTLTRLPAGSGDHRANIGVRPG